MVFQGCFGRVVRGARIRRNYARVWARTPQLSQGKLVRASHSREMQTSAHFEIQRFASEARRVVRAAADMFLQDAALPALSHYIALSLT